jgi:hypothetical protein
VTTLISCYYIGLTRPPLWKSFDFELSDDEMDQIFALNANGRVVQVRNHS